MHRRPVAHLVELDTGVRVGFTEQGDRRGPSILLLHAWVESSRSFDRVTPLLPPSLHVLALDLRGHGRSDAPEDGYDLESAAADVVAFLDALDVSSVVLVGSSSGGYVAQQVAVRNPRRVAGLVLVGSPSDLRARAPFAADVEGLSDPVDPAWVRSFLGTFLRSAEVPDWYLDERVHESAGIPARVWALSLAGLTSSPPPLETGSISAATLVIWGDRDELLTYDDQAALAGAIPRSRLRTYEGVGHLVLWEQPERLAADVVEFVRDITV